VLISLGVNPKPKLPKDGVVRVVIDRDLDFVGSFAARRAAIARRANLFDGE
jgi:hypothetical protein